MRIVIARLIAMGFFIGIVVSAIAIVVTDPFGQGYNEAKNKAVKIYCPDKCGKYDINYNESYISDTAIKCSCVDKVVK
jgi:hypothetical protein